MHARAAARILIVLAAAVMIPRAAGAQRVGGAPVIRPVQLWTEDGVRLTGDLYEPQQPSGAAVILHHSLGQDRSALRPLAERLARAHIHVVNMDVRGHGQSRYRRTVQRGVTGGMQNAAYAIPLDTVNYDQKNFQAMDWAQLPVDVQQVQKFVREQRRVKGGRIVLLGSSISANAALVAAIQSRPRGIVLLSPGENYRGIAIAVALEELGERPVFAVAAEGDAPAYRGAGLVADTGGGADVRFVRGRAHGERLLTSIPGLTDELMRWLLQTLGVQLPIGHPDLELLE